MITLESYLCGAWHQGNGKPQVLINPATEEPLAEVSSAGLDLAAAVRHAREVGGPALRERTFGERAALLGALSKAIHEHREALLRDAPAPLRAEPGLDPEHKGSSARRLSVTAGVRSPG